MSAQPLPNEKRAVIDRTYTGCPVDRSYIYLGTRPTKELS